MSDLDKLIEAMSEDKYKLSRSRLRAFCKSSGLSILRDATGAFDGDVGAAKNLHNKLLPDCDYYMRENKDLSSYSACIWAGPIFGVACKSRYSTARAWLLAILIVYRFNTQTQDEGWQPIETAPKDGTEVLIYYPEWGGEKDVLFAATYDEGRAGMEDIEGTWYAFHYGHTGDGATHWMPLPAPPAPRTK